MYGMIKLDENNSFSWGITYKGKVVMRGMRKDRAEELLEQLNSDE